MSAKLPVANTETSQTRSRDTSVDQQRYGASAYIDQSEYDSYKQSTVNPSSQIAKQDRPSYSNYSTETNNHNQKKTYVQDDVDDDDDVNYTNNQQHYTKNSSTTSYSNLLGRSNSYNGLQPRVISAKQRNISGSSSLYQVMIFCWKRTNENDD